MTLDELLTVPYDFGAEPMVAEVDSCGVVCIRPDRDDAPPVMLLSQDAWNDLQTHLLEKREPWKSNVEWRKRCQDAAASVGPGRPEFRR